MRTSRWLIAAFAAGAAVALTAAVVVVVLLVFAAQDSGDSGDDDLDEAIAFLDAAINVDIRPSEGEILYWRSEDEGLDAQTPGVREFWRRIGPELMAVETLSRESDEDGHLIDERHRTEESQLVWAKDGAYQARTGLVDGSFRVVELTDETVTVEFRIAAGEWSSHVERYGIEDAVEDVGRITFDDSGLEVEQHIFVLTESGEEVTLSRSHISYDIVDDMPAPTSP